MEHLHALGAVDTRFALTTKGRKMADFPLAPIYASMLLRSAEFGCTEVRTFFYVANIDPRQQCNYMGHSFPSRLLLLTHLARRRPSLWWRCCLPTTSGTTQAANRNVRRQKLGTGYYPTHMVTTYLFLLCGARTQHTAAESCSSNLDQAGQAASKTGVEKIS
eukprot:COSAG02_NODE_481_length_21461_cov_43.885597_14_plen_162_part_00